jgi:hypothetical protein
VSEVKVWTTDGYDYHASLGGKVWQCPSMVIHLPPRQYLDWACTQEGMPESVIHALWRQANHPPVYKTGIQPAPRVVTQERGAVKIPQYTPEPQKCWDILAYQLHLTVPQVQALFHDLKDPDIEDMVKRLEWLDCDRV